MKILQEIIAIFENYGDARFSPAARNAEQQRIIRDNVAFYERVKKEGERRQARKSKSRSHSIKTIGYLQKNGKPVTASNIRDLKPGTIVYTLVGLDFRESYGPVKPEMIVQNYEPKYKPGRKFVVTNHGGFNFKGVKSFEIDTSKLATNSIEEDSFRFVIMSA